MLKCKKSFKDFYQYYILVFTVIAITVFIQTITQYSLKKQQTAAALINIAGKQRMLSQKVLANFYELRFSKGDFSELQASVKNLYNTNKELKKGNYNRGLKAIEDAEILKMFANLDVHLNYINSNLQDADNIKNVNIAPIKKEVNTFLKLMDEIVLVLQRKSEQEVSAIMRIELQLAFLSIIIILLEVFFIIKPAIKKITIQNKKLQEISWHQTYALNSHIRNLKDLQLVLAIEQRMEHKEELFDCVLEELDELEEVSSNMVKSLETSN